MLLFLPFLQQKPCQRRKYLIMNESSKKEVSDIGHFVRNRTLDVYGNGQFLEFPIPVITNNV